MSDRLYIRRADGSTEIPASVHPIPDLLDRTPEQVLSDFKESQARDFSAVLDEAATPGNRLHDLLAELREQAGEDNALLQTPAYRQDALRDIFLDLHDHVMSHPVWRHPFFVRLFEGPVTLEQVRTFAVHYFNQVKNTRQCVALALGRFNSLMDMPYDPVHERVSAYTQVILGQLLADEYGVGTHAVEDYPDLASLFRSHTHTAMYRQMFDGLGVPPAEQEVPLLPETADNVLTQRLLASDPAFSHLEALASVGLGMEWGVPEIFTLILGGLIRFARDTETPLTPDHLEVFVAHVQYDVLHAVAVMMATSLHMRTDRDVDRVKEAVNALMAARHNMMDGVYRTVFGEACTPLSEYSLEDRHILADRRIGSALIAARRDVAENRVTEGAAYHRRTETPFPFRY